MEIKENVELVGVWNAVVKNAAGEVVSNHTFKNLIPTVGRTAMAAQHADNYTNAMKVTYLAVGSSTTAPANGDTTLGTETARKILGSNTSAANESSVAVFFAAGEATGTHREFGAFGDGSATTASGSADSGIMYSHTAANVIVGASETLTLTYKTTFN